MISFWDVVQRSESGPLVEEGQFDRLVGRTAKEVIQKYKIKYNPEEVVPSDDGLIDRLYEAAVEFFLTVGVYCTDTGRVIRFERHELEEYLEAGVDHIVWGEGRDQRTMYNRTVEDRRPPFCNFTLVGTPYPEAQFLQACMSTAREPLAYCFSGPSLLDTLGGVMVRSGSPIEVEAAIWDVGKRREAARRVGYPGKGLYTMVSAAERADAMIAAARPEFGALPRDGVLCGAIAEMKVDNDRMKKVPFLLRTTYSIGGLLGPLMGGYAGGPEGTSIVLVAHNFLSRMVFNSEYTVNFPIDLRQTCNTTRAMLWLVSTAHQALARNTHLLHFANTFIGGQPVAGRRGPEQVPGALHRDGGPHLRRGRSCGGHLRGDPQGGQHPGQEGSRQIREADRRRPDREEVLRVLRHGEGRADRGVPGPVRTGQERGPVLGAGLLGDSRLRRSARGWWAPGAPGGIPRRTKSATTARP
jgi:methylamine--corrinoid protein Co-methyltransferase